MYIITQNHAGGARIRHRTIGAAARRIARGPDEVYLGYRIAEIWGPNENGEYVAWSVGPSGGEHLRGTSEEALVRRVMGLA